MSVVDPLVIGAAVVAVGLSLQVVEIGIGVHNARRGKRIEGEVRRVVDRLESRGLLKGGVDPLDAVASREAKKLGRLIDAAETEAQIVAQYGDLALGVKALMGPSWDAAMSGGLGAAMRIVKPFLEAQNRQQKPNGSHSGWK